jgi:glycosyltransferase involved in cell wall biosynthesis
LTAVVSTWQKLPASVSSTEAAGFCRAADAASVGAEAGSFRRAAMPMVLHVRVVSGRGGGPEKTILNSPRYLKHLGYESLCAYLRSPGDAGYSAIEDRAAEFAAPLVTLDDRGPLDWRLFGRLRTLCRERNVAVWHGHDYKSNFLGLLLRRFHPMKLVTTVHGWVEKTGKLSLYYRIDKSCLKRYERVLCVSDDLFEESRRIGVPAERCALVPNAIDEEAYRRTLSTADAKRKLGHPPGRPLVGAVGRLSDEKGFDRLIQAVDLLAKRGVDVGLAIAGEGNRREALESLISQRGLAERVQLLGHRSDVSDLYQAMDVFALSSIREGLPNVVLEAMALETPVVATRVAGVPALIADGENGLLVDPGDAEQLAAAIGDLLEQPQRRNALARAARRTIEERFSFRARMEKVAAIYDELLRNPQQS